MGEARQVCGFRLDFSSACSAVSSAFNGERAARIEINHCHDDHQSESHGRQGPYLQAFVVADYRSQADSHEAGEKSSLHEAFEPAS